MKPRLPLHKRPYRKGVGIVLLNGQGQAFVAQRLDHREPAWQFPQGGIDEGEDPRATALRELEEEIGVSPDKVEIIAETEGWVSYDLPAELADVVWKGRYRGQTQKWFLLRFKGKDGDINLKTAHPEFSEWRWMDLAEVPNRIVPFKRALYELVVAEFLPLTRRLAEGV